MKKIVNPFFAALLAVGLAFAVTTCAYTVMSFRNLDPNTMDEPGISTLMKEYGVLLLGSELGLLTLLTIAAISTDDYWTRRAQK